MGNQGKINILLIEDEDFDVRRVKNTIKFSKEKISIKHVVSNGNSAIDLLKNKHDEYDIVIMDEVCVAIYFGLLKTEAVASILFRGLNVQVLHGKHLFKSGFLQI